MEEGSRLWAIQGPTFWGLPQHLRKPRPMATCPLGCEVPQDLGRMLRSGAVVDQGGERVGGPQEVAMPPAEPCQHSQGSPAKDDGLL
jgi:hypothetical protein